MLLIASATHDLNMCRRDLFKVDLDDTYKAIRSSKQPVGLELFGDNLTERLKKVKESNKAAKQLTGHKRKRNEQYSRSSYSARGSSIAGGITTRDTPEEETTTSSATKTTRA